MSNFKEHPEHINRKGRPPKGETITDLVKEYLRKEVPNIKDKLTYKDLFVKKVLDKAYKGDMQAIKLLWNYKQILMTILYQ